MKLCGKCKIEKEDDAFAIKYKHPDGLIVRQWQCKPCQSDYRKNHYQGNKQKYIDKAKKWDRARKIEVYKFLVEYFKQNPCVDCGETNPVVLEFDHVKGIKENNISVLITHNFESLLEEIKKCEVRCANCHRIKTAVQFKWLILDVMKSDGPM